VGIDCDESGQSNAGIDVAGHEVFAKIWHYDVV